MIGKILKNMRKDANLSQEQLSKLIGYARNTISQYETETLQPDFKTIENISNKCGFEIKFINKSKKIEYTSKNINRKEI